MDSLNSLTRSLPRSSGPPPEDLLHAFKEAANRVTLLYKHAAGARAAGYQDALDDVLALLDREKLSDGSASRIRQWANERLDGDRAEREESAEEDAGPGDAPVEDRDKVDKVDKAECEDATERSPVKKPMAPASLSDITANTTTTIIHPTFRQQHGTDAFTFRSDLPPSMDLDLAPQSLEGAVQQPTRSAARRKQQHQQHHNARTTGHRERDRTGVSHGAKRKMAMGDFFDVGDLKDVKKGRFG